MLIKIPKLKKPQGFTLLEVMIAMVIFAVGMLGLAGIQAISLQNNNTAYQRTVAMQQAYNMADLVRAAVNFDGSVDSTFDDDDTDLGAAPAACFHDTTTLCSNSVMAAFNIWHWKNRLKDELPSGRGIVKLVSAGEYEIIIMWDEKRSGATLEGCGINGAADLKCYKLQIQV